MREPDEAIAQAAAELIELAGRDGGIVLELVRVQAREGVGVAFYGTDPAEASVAVVEFASLEHRVPVVDGFYAFTERVPVEPEEPPPTSRRFE